MEELRVATFNVRNGRAFDGWNSWPFRKRSTAEVIDRIDADVIGLQEVFGFQQRFLHEQLRQYDFRSEARSGRFWGERCPVLVRVGAEMFGHRTIWFGGKRGRALPGARFPRIATICELRLPGKDVRLQFVSTHLDERKAENRLISVRQLVEELDPATPTVIVGDFNDVFDSQVIRVLESAGFPAVPIHDKAGTAHGFSGSENSVAIDHILVSAAHFEFDEARTFTDRPGGRLPSDHWPVVANLRIRP